MDETIIDLMESIAKEELALSHLINSESQKINAFVGKNLNFPTNPTNSEILTFNQSVNRMIDTVLMKEWLLLKKLETVTHIKSSYDHSSETCCCDEKDKLPDKSEKKKKDDWDKPCINEGDINE